MDDQGIEFGRRRPSRIPKLQVQQAGLHLSVERRRRPPDELVVAGELASMVDGARFVVLKRHAPRKVRDGATATRLRIWVSVLHTRQHGGAHAALQGVDASGAIAATV